MRDFFIDALETIIGAMIVLGGVTILISGVVMMFSADEAQPIGPQFAAVACATSKSL